MVRSYLRHEPTSAFGLICSPSFNSILDSDGKTAFVPALEDVLVWDVRRATLLATWHEIGHRSKVTALARSPTDPDTFAVGYEDGSIRLWSFETNSTSVTFNGHKKAVIALTFDTQGVRLASASLDTDIILWDLIAESGLYRLRGHRAAVTSVAFVHVPASIASHSEAPSTSTTTTKLDTDSPGYLLSTSKDGLLKLWDLSLQHCVETVVPGGGEITSLAVSQDLSLSLEASSKASTNDDAEHDDRQQVPDGGALVLTGSAEGELKVWEIAAATLTSGLQSIMNDRSDSSKFLIPRGTIPLTSKKRVTQIQFCGVPKLNDSNASTSHSQGYIAVSSTSHAVQIFRLRSTEEMAKKLERRRKREKEKAEKKRAKGQHINGQDSIQVSSIPEHVTWLDRIESYTHVRPMVGRLKSFHLVTPTNPNTSSSSASNKFGLSVLCALSSNALEVYNVPSPPRTKAEKANPIEPVLASALEAPGHRADIRAVDLSSDDTLLASADSADQLKIWNVKTGRCIRTLPCGYALSVAWLPGDQHVLVGCKDGSLRSYDIRAGIAVETIQAHQGPLWSVAIQPDGLGCVSASADKEVKFWEFEMRSPEAEAEEDEESESSSSDEEESKASARKRPAGPPQLALVHVRTLKMTDDVLCAKFSPNGKLLALSLLDNTVKVFFADSLKFFLSLYGHKLPVLALDISSDSKLCVTVSADKNIKIWGLDFGDCHKSIFGHNESIMGVKFEKGFQGGGLLGGREGESHHFWTISKDASLKHWDGDRFVLIQELLGHHGEIWSLAVSNSGSMVVTGGSDTSIRVWEKTDEPLFLEEERERELERVFESSSAGGRDGRDEELGIGALAEGGSSDPATATGIEATSVSKSTRETMLAGERLMEALEIADEDIRVRTQARQSGQPEPSYHGLIKAEFDNTMSRHNNGVAITNGDAMEGDDLAQRYVLRTLEKILPSQLEDSILVLSMERIYSLMRYLDYFSQKEWNMPLTSRILFFLLRTHYEQIINFSSRKSTTTNPTTSHNSNGAFAGGVGMKATLLSIQKNLNLALQKQKLTIGFNLQALKFIQQQHKAAKLSQLYERNPQSILSDDDQILEKLNKVRKRKLLIR